MDALQIKNLTFSYPKASKKALDNISLTIKRGEFITLFGKSGCGKSTLLRHLKPEISPYGEKSGEILFFSQPIDSLPDKESAQKIGYVFQNPDNQIVTDKVWYELAFGLENLGINKSAIRRRVAEMASFFGINSWYMKDVSSLSGGQKQTLNLASIMALQPEILILDEPTSQLDPIAASEFLETVYKINREFGTTVIITEHRLEEVFPMSDRAIAMEDGKIIADDTPRATAEKLKSMNNDIFASMPSAMQIYEKVKTALPCPITVREGREFLDNITEGKIFPHILRPNKDEEAQDVIKMKDVWFKYSKDGNDVVSDLSFNVKKGSVHAIVGGNGSGKTTTLRLACKVLKPYRGKIYINGKNILKYSDNQLYNGLIGMLPQNQQALFVKDTVFEDLKEVCDDASKINEICELTEISMLLDMHPYDLSGGEQQRAALAKVLLKNPQILLLDEPTKGFDSCFKQHFADILRALTKKGVTVLMVSHDVEFCAKYADYCSMFFNGNITTTDEAREFFAGNRFYTTSANRMARHIIPNAVTNEEVIELCQNL